MINFTDQRQCSWVVAHCQLWQRSPRRYWLFSESEASREHRRFFRLFFRISWGKSERYDQISHKKSLDRVNQPVKSTAIFPSKKHISGMVTVDDFIL
ncbi:hypothetical protein AN403_6009 [Pseudomonas fluorescens]|uniref:Uncharacterized protein n=1 Tax=Pseudomonas fluorescens TaxID=294 RepID=A0A0P8XWX1_PSEFL|nr:hypothetical protein AN403_6009 [Pseudomonas fluorescens]